MSYQDNALPNTLTIGDPAAPTLVLHNRSADGNGDGIVQIGGVFGVDVVGDTLSIDEVDATIQYGREPDVGMTVYEVYLSPENEVYVGPDDAIYSRLLASVPDGTRGALVDLSAIPYGTPIKWEHAGRTIAAFYLDTLRRVGKYQYRLAATSGVGLLDKDTHPGGIYTGETFLAVATDIIGGRFPFTVVGALAEQEVYGWLPYDTRRNNLHQLLFAFGASLRRTSAGAAQIAFLSAAAPLAVPDSRVSFDGDVQYETPTTTVSITEHSFYANAADEDVTLFDNTEDNTPASHTLVIFDTGGPVYDLVTTGTLSIDDSGAAYGVNWARVTGKGTLTGKLYSHNTRIVTETAPGTPIQPNVKEVTDYTLINFRNSLNVALRVFDYFQSARAVSASIALDGERCGDILSLKDPFLDPMTAFLESVTVNASTNLWGPARLIENYTPRYQGNSATHSEILTGAGTWKTWTSTFTGTLEFVLISGAQGGNAGNDGGDSGQFAVVERSGWISNTGRQFLRYNAQVGFSLGGQPGDTPGAGGRLYFGHLNITEGQEVAFYIGRGGAGGVRGVNNGQGAFGEDTVFGSASSASGQSTPSGFTDPISGNTYAMSGNSGIYGGNGAGIYNGEFIDAQAITVDGVEYSGGVMGSYDQDWFDTTSYPALELIAEAIGGFGGGGAYGGFGQNGEDGSVTIAKDGQGGATLLKATPGRGGNGADATPPPKASIPGQGGTSGNGGGGAGSYGSGPPIDPYTVTPTSSVTFTLITGYSMLDTVPQQIEQTPIDENYGRGGHGSNGGEGADGAIILFRGG